MEPIRDQRNIDALRQRLYDRNPGSVSVQSSPLRPQETTAPVAWNIVEEPAKVVDMSPKAVGKRNRFRAYVLFVSVLIFMVTAAFSVAYLYMGGNQISADNISVSLSVPFTIPGGEVLPIQVSLTNQNSVPIESATIILNYPQGTRSIEGSRDIYEERIPVDGVAPGQAFNVPVRVQLSGEENESKEVKASVEYRVAGSNGTFYKEAVPQVVKLSSSPLVMRMSGVDKISSGQEMTITMELKSNASTPQKNLLVTASYPESFVFLEANPEPAFGKNSWVIDEVGPEGTFTITLKGRVEGIEGEVSEIQAKVGTAESGNQFMLASALAQAVSAFTIEQPFTAVSVDVNGDTDGSVIVGPGEVAQVAVNITNTLSESIYDVRVEIQPEGNLASDKNLSVSGGFYDSTTKKIVYEVSGNSELAEIKPGESRSFFFSVLPDQDQSEASFRVSTNIFARRVNEAEAAEAIIGTSKTEVKYSSIANLANQVGRDDGPFADSGPVPPVADTATTYTVTLVASAGVNGMTGAVVTTNLPQYVGWLNATSGDGRVEFNPVSKQIRWAAGDIPARGNKSLQFQISLTPSVTQVGQKPVIVGTQVLRATDRFTGVALRAEGKSLINELSSEFGFVTGNGTVQAKGR